MLGFGRRELHGHFDGFLAGFERVKGSRNFRRVG